MAYNPKNKLLRILDIQRIVKDRCIEGGETKEWVFENIIYPRYRISRRSFFNYMDTSAGVQLARIEREESKQLNLF